MKPEFVKMLASLGDARFDGLAEALKETSPEISVRLNPLKGGTETAIAASAESRVEWWDNGVYLPTRPRFTFDPSLHQGRYYVQDASSMITAAVARAISKLIGETTPLLWLDACAAPGGKTTAAIDGLPAGSLVVANEYDYSRAEILKENVAKWGYPSTVITRGDTAQYRRLCEIFDVIAIDAPCSGEGMMRKDLTAREQWTPSLVEECADRQKEIIDNLWDALRPGGYLVYSTCTFNTSEDELIADYIRKEYGAEAIDLPTLLGRPADNIDREVKIDGVEPLHSLRFIPGRTRGEGLYISILRKPGDLTPASLDIIDHKDKKRSKPAKASNKGAGPGQKSLSLSEITKLCGGWIREEFVGNFEFSATEDGVRAFPSQWSAHMPLFLKHLQVISAGTEIATIKGKDVIPTQQLALSNLLCYNAFPVAEISAKEAVEYLSRESITLPDGAPRGIVLLTYGGYPLGFVKNLGNRSNNLYPKEWRIKSKA